MIHRLMAISMRCCGQHSSTLWCAAARRSALVAARATSRHVKLFPCTTSIPAFRSRLLVPCQTAVRGAQTVAAAAVDAAERIQEYDAEQIQVLEGLDPVRKRPGMYIGSTGQRGLHHLVYEVLDNSIDEVQGGHASVVTIDVDLTTGWVAVRDDGRGIPTGFHPKTGKSALETVLTVLHAGGKFSGPDSGYKVSGGLHGVGLSVVNALSEHLEVKVWREGKEYQQEYQRGAPVTEMSVADLPAGQEASTGTQVRFLYDRTIFSKTAAFERDTIRSRVRELAFLNSRATLLLRVSRTGDGADEDYSCVDAIMASAMPSGTDATASSGTDAGPHSAAEHSGAVKQSRTVIATTDSGEDAAAEGTSGTGALDGGAREGMEEAENGSENGSVAGFSGRTAGWEVFHFEGGLREYVKWMNAGKHTMHPVVTVCKEVEGVVVEVALQWTLDSYSDTLVGFTNSIRTVDGGTHIDGFKTALTRTMNALARKLKLLKEGDGNLLGEHVREGLAAVIAVKVPNPEFEGQTKTRLGNPEVRKIVEGVVAQEVGEWLEMHPEDFGAVVGKAQQAAKAADAAKKARELVRRKNVLTRSTLPGKLADCTSGNKAESEIFLVEGDSAGGSAKQARDRKFQAILPLRGKILNVERKDDASMYKNEEISNLIVALGLGPKGYDSNLSSLRYNKIVILTDADVDGAHIRTLLLTFLFRYNKALFEQGHVYAAVPPLYRVDVKGKKTWCYDEAQLQHHIQGMASGSYSVQRFKGLGEMMPQQLWNTTMDPTARTLRRLTIDDVAEAGRMFTMLMGADSRPRRRWIEESSSLLSPEALDV